MSKELERPITFNTFNMLVLFSPFPKTRHSLANVIASILIIQKNLRKLGLCLYFLICLDIPNDSKKSSRLKQHCNESSCTIMVGI